MEFPPTARIDTRLTVPDWPAAPDERVEQAVVGVTTFELANAVPAVVEDGAARHLVWHGYLTGGLLTLYERLGALLSSHGLGAFYADPRLEVFVPADGEVEQLAPGEVDYDLLDESDFELTEQYDPEGNLDESWVSCHVLRWRTDFVPPGTVRAPDRRLEDAQGWRVSQWEWVPQGDDEDDDGSGGGQWMLRGYAPVPAAMAVDHLPQPLLDWVRRMTREAVELFEAVAEEETEFAVAAARLRTQLAALG